MQFSNLPGFATDPPTMRVCATFENPHPSSDVSKRPVATDAVNPVASVRE